MQAYSSKNDQPSKEKAIAVLKEAAAKHPDNKGIQVAIKQLENPVEGLEDQFKRIEAGEGSAPAQPVTGRVVPATGDMDKAFARLSKRKRLAPDANGIMAAMFDQYLRRKEFDKAGQYLERLAKKNADNADGQVFRIRFALGRANLRKRTSRRRSSRRSAEISRNSRAARPNAAGAKPMGRSDQRVSSGKIARPETSMRCEGWSMLHGDRPPG